jgi:ssDNA-binding Zn-finger/Zn-ribbon topoisomerase 1
MKLGKKLTKKREIDAYQKFLICSKTTEYDYSESIYIGAGIKIEIRCQKHGTFEQLPSNHRNGQGCPKCKFEKVSKHNQSTSKDFIEKAIKVHKNQYQYKNVNYIGSKSKVVLTCPVHGNFTQIPSDHLSGKGCQKCARKLVGELNTFTTKTFVEKANEVHKYKYNYSSTIYTKMQNKVTVICPAHGHFIQKAANHIQGQGCPSCGHITTLQKHHEHPTILYLLFFPKLNLYKLGITMVKRGIKTRYEHEPEPYQIIQQIVFEEGKTAYELEQYLLNKYATESYIGKPVLVNGNTELFYTNILQKQLFI